MEILKLVIIIGVLKFNSCGNSQHHRITPCQDDTILVFTKTAGHRHVSIEAGVELLKSLAERNDYKVIHTEDSTIFDREDLIQFKAIVFLNTTGNVLSDSQQEKFKNYIRRGGGFVGIHSAADTEYDWPWYGQLVGAYFLNHPQPQAARLYKTDHENPSTSHLGQTWHRSDEWYNYKKIYSKIKPVLILDETSYEGGTNGDDHPIAWYHYYDGGRAFYTGGGHTIEAYSEPDFAEHVSRGILWAMGRE